MPLNENQSQHHPLLLGGTASVTGSLTIDLGVRDVQAVNVSPGFTPAAGNAHVKGMIDRTGRTAKLTLYVFEATYGAASSTVDVHWTAIAK